MVNKKIFGSKYWFKILYVDEKGKARIVWLKAKNELVAKLKLAANSPNKTFYYVQVFGPYTERTKKLHLEKYWR
jgi:hypothetical protein